MSKWIMFSGDPTQAEGRNGWFKAIGISVRRIDAGLGVQLENINSRRNIAKGSIALPSDAATIRLLIEQLEYIAKEIEGRTHGDVS